MTSGLDDAAVLPAPATPASRARKLRQAAFAYLHVGVLYESAVYAMHRQGLIPMERGPLWLWMALGVLIVAVIFWGLWFKELVWLARIVWALHAMRLPALITGAFFPVAGAAIPTSFYVVALAVVLVNLWMLARAGWDI